VAGKHRQARAACATHYSIFDCLGVIRLACVSPQHERRVTLHAIPVWSLLCDPRRSSGFRLAM